MGTQLLYHHHLHSQPRLRHNAASSTILLRSTDPIPSIDPHQTISPAKSTPSLPGATSTSSTPFPLPPAQTLHIRKPLLHNLLPLSLSHPQTPRPATFCLPTRPRRSSHTPSETRIRNDIHLHALQHTQHAPRQQTRISQRQCSDYVSGV